MPSILLALALALTLPLAPADDEAFSIRQTARRIAAEALSSQATYALLQDLCAVAPRRLAGTAAADRAVEWGKSAMEKAGLENVRFEPVLAPKWVRGEVERLIVVEPAEANGEELPILALGGTIGTPARGITAEVVRVTGFPALEALGEEGGPGQDRALRHADGIRTARSFRRLRASGPAPCERRSVGSGARRGGEHHSVDDHADRRSPPYRWNAIP